MTGFPFALQQKPDHGGPLPEAVDCVVIGGGVIGVTAALFLRRRGLSVLLAEKGRIAAEQSSRNWGWVRVQGRDPAEIPIALEARRLWDALDRACGGRCGLAVSGVSYLARDGAEMDRYAQWQALGRAHGIDCVLWDRAALRARMPSDRGDWAGALHTASDLRAEPWQAVPQIARLAAEEGALIRERCAVRGLDLAAGRIAAVLTEAGRVRCGAVVLAGGAWSRLFLRRHGVDIPQLSVRASVAATGPLPPVFDGAAADHRLAFRRRADGGYTIAPSGFSELFLGPDAFRSLRAYWPVIRAGGEYDAHLRGPAPRHFPDGWGTPRRWAPDRPGPFEACRILDPAPNAARLDRALAGFAAVFPDLGPVPLRARWAGMIDVLPDLVPVVDHVPDLPGLVLATGMSGHGFGIGPAFGRIVADLVAGRPPGHDLARFRFGRFSDGTRPRPGPAL